MKGHQQRAQDQQLSHEASACRDRYGGGDQEEEIVGLAEGASEEVRPEEDTT
jgi:hypothetical protein